MTDEELELMRVMHDPPMIGAKEVSKWIAKMQSLCVRVGRIERKRGKSEGK